MDNLETIREALRNRVFKRLEKIPFATDLGLNEFYVGGNSLNRVAPNDIDLFPVEKRDFINCSKADNYTVIHTKNAHTINLHGKVIQLCDYHYPSLAELIESFDFAHIKVGAKIIAAAGGIEVREVYFSEDWLVARSLESTFYTGSTYPLSSMVRCFKYHRRGDFAGKSYIGDVLLIVKDIAQRGFADYEDFKNQLDAVDLGLLPDEIDDIGNAAVMELFEALKK